VVTDHITQVKRHVKMDAWFEMSRWSAKLQKEWFDDLTNWLCK